jgi:Mn2+/Fe2+ NRAMP family transporter
VLIEATEDELLVPPAVVVAVARRQWLGPGLMSGVSANDPSSLVIYSAAGAQFGVSISWVMLLLLPMMSAMQEISARLGRATGRGFAANTRDILPRWLLTGIVVALLVSNIVTIAADLNAMGSVCGLLIGGPAIAYVVAFGVLIAALQMTLSYDQYARAVKGSALLLAVYVVAAFAVGVPWTTASYEILRPSILTSDGFVMMFVALLGTVISPYMYFWQASLEAEEIRIGKGERDMAHDLPRLRFDTFLGMALSNVIGVAIIVVSALGLHHTGLGNLSAAVPTVDALGSADGASGYLLFAIAIIGSGIVGIPLLSGSTGYVVAEWRHWTSGINHSAGQARAFYGVIVLSIGVGILLNLLQIKLVDAQVISGFVSTIAVVPILVAMMVLAVNRRLMGTMALPRWLAVGGWLTTAIMAVAAILAIVGQLTGD